MCPFTCLVKYPFVSRLKCLGGYENILSKWENLQEKEKDNDRLRPEDNRAKVSKRIIFKGEGMLFLFLYPCQVFHN